LKAENLKYSTMLKKLNLSDKLLLLAAFISLFFSEALWYAKDYQHAIFVGLWVPTILAFGIYFRTISK
jgi:hypothetical protein